MTNKFWMTVILQMNSSGLYELFKVFDPTYDEMCARGSGDQNH